MVGLARFNFIVPLHFKILVGQTQHICHHTIIKRTVVNDKTFIEKRKENTLKIENNSLILFT